MTKRGFATVVGVFALTCGSAVAQGVPPYDTNQLDAPAPAPTAAPAPPPPAAPMPDAPPDTTPDSAGPQQLSPPPGPLGALPAGAPPGPAPGVPPAPGAYAAEPPHPDTVPGLLDAARSSAGAGQLQVADDLVAQAETRLLDRSVEVGTNGQPIETPMIQALASARHALEAGQQAQAIAIINDAIAHMLDIGPAQ